MVFRILCWLWLVGIWDPLPFMTCGMLVKNVHICEIMLNLIRFLDVAEVRASKGRRETRPSSVARMFCFRHWCVPQYGFWGRETRPP